MKYVFWEIIFIDLFFWLLHFFNLCLSFYLLIIGIDRVMLLCVSRQFWLRIGKGLLYFSICNLFNYWLGFVYRPIRLFFIGLRRRRILMLEFWGCLRWWNRTSLLLLHRQFAGGEEWGGRSLYQWWWHFRCLHNFSLFWFSLCLRVYLLYFNLRI